MCSLNDWVVGGMYGSLKYLKENLRSWTDGSFGRELMKFAISGSNDHSSFDNVGSEDKMNGSIDRSACFSFLNQTFEIFWFEITGTNFELSALRLCPPYYD